MYKLGLHLCAEYCSTPPSFRPSAVPGISFFGFSQVSSRRQQDMLIPLSTTTTTFSLE